MFNRKYFQRISSQAKRTALMAKMEDFREDLLDMIAGDEVPVKRVERRITYLNRMSIAELCILLNAARLLLETGNEDWSTNVKVASKLIQKLCY